ncbi:MAG: hypothetical protein GYA33_07305, partial [Thermogutta sp.]|nr:hypothetical protein [Thermogutta sp.]
LISIGAYRRGGNPLVDTALSMREDIDGFLRQDMRDRAEYPRTVARLLQLAEQIAGAAARSATQRPELTGQGGGATAGGNSAATGGPQTAGQLNGAVSAQAHGNGGAGTARQGRWPGSGAAAGQPSAAAGPR